jgi:hypothetical protein
VVERLRPSRRASTPVHRAVATTAALLLVAGLLAMLVAPGPAGAQTGTTASSGATTVLSKLQELNKARVDIRQIALTPSGGAVILHGANDATWIQAPSAIGAKLRALINARSQIRFVAFDQDGDWVILHGTNEASWSRLRRDLVDKIREFQAEDKRMKGVAFTPSGEWSILHGSNGGYHSSGIPKAAFDKLIELNRAGGVAIRSIAYSPGGGWVILHGTNDATWSGIPQATIAKIRELHAAGHRMKQVAFTRSGGWIILWGGNGYNSAGLQ